MDVRAQVLVLFLPDFADCGRAQKHRRSQSPDLPLPHGLAPSETMVWDYGLTPPLSTENPGNRGFSGSGVPTIGFGLADPTPKG